MERRKHRNIRKVAHLACRWTDWTFAHILRLHIIFPCANICRHKPTHPHPKIYYMYNFECAPLRRVTIKSSAPCGRMLCVCSARPKAEHNYKMYRYTAYTIFTLTCVMRARQRNIIRVNFGRQKTATVRRWCIRSNLCVSVFAHMRNPYYRYCYALLLASPLFNV